MGKVEDFAFEVALAVLKHKLEACATVEEAIDAALKAHIRVIQEAVTIKKNISGPFV